ncbi:unnamed protein product [Hanseniaspora opuntiae]|jgi:hypothetical protein
MLIRFIFPKSNHFGNYVTKMHKMRYSTDLPVNNVKNIKLYNLMMRYKFIQKLYANPKYKSYFYNLFNSSTKSVVISFMILHELTATIPFIGLWYFLYQKCNFLEEKSLNIENDAIDQTDESIMGKLNTKINEYMKISEASVKRFIGKFVNTEDLNADQIKFLTLTGVVSYATVKVIAPFRIMLSVMMTPKLANIFQRGFNMIFLRK